MVAGRYITIVYIYIYGISIEHLVDKCREKTMVLIHVCLHGSWNQWFISIWSVLFLLISQKWIYSRFHWNICINLALVSLQTASLLAQQITTIYYLMQSLVYYFCYLLLLSNDVQFEFASIFFSTLKDSFGKTEQDNNVFSLLYHFIAYKNIFLVFLFFINMVDVLYIY